MDFELIAAVELHRAHLAVEELKVQMSALVVAAVSIGDESLAAEFARERLFPGVRSEMVNQASLVSQDFLAFSVWTLILLDV